MAQGDTVDAWKYSRKSKAKADDFDFKLDDTQVKSFE